MKPPVANTTALAAPTRTVAPSAVVASTPTTRPPWSRTTRCTRCPVLTSTPSLSAAALRVLTATAPPSDMVSLAASGSSTRPVGALSSGSSAQ